jgi:hypothetical protein
VVLDFDADGALVGIDVQHASQRADLSNLSLSKMPFGESLAVYVNTLACLCVKQSCSISIFQHVCRCAE